MQSYISVNTAEVAMRDAVRNELQSKMDEFLKSNKITVLETRTESRYVRPDFNSVINMSPAKAKQVGASREEIVNLVRDLSTIEIEGVTIRRSAAEVAKAMRQRGYKMRAPSVKRIAESIGVNLSL